MEGIFVNETRMSNCSSSMANQSDKVKVIREQIATVKRKLSGDISLKSGLDRRLSKAHDACGDHASLIAQMAEVIDSAREMYRACENGIVNQSKVSANRVDTSQNQEQKYSDLIEFVNDPKSSLLFANFTLDSEKIGDMDFWDALLISLGKGDDIVIDKIRGKDYETELIKENLAKVLQNMDARTGTGEVPEEVKLVVEAISCGEKLPGALESKYGSLIESMDAAGYVLEYGQEGIKLLEYVLTDYSNDIETLELLRETNINHANTVAAVDEMIMDYQNKFLGSVKKVLDVSSGIVIEESGEIILDTATGGLYTLVDLGKDIVLYTSGASGKIDAMESLMANTIVSADIQQGYFEAMDTLRGGEFTAADVANAQRLFDLQKATKVAQYESVLQIVKSEYQSSGIISQLTKKEEWMNRIASIEKDIAVIKSLEMNTASINKVFS